MDYLITDTDVNNIRDLCKAIIACAGSDYQQFVVKKKKEPLWCRQYGGAEAELTKFFLSDWCEDILQHANIHLAGKDLLFILQSKKR